MLESFSLFTGLPSKVLNDLESRCQRVTLDIGETVFEQGQLGKEVFLIEQGRIEILIKGYIRPTKTIATLEPGDFFGEMSTLNDSPYRSATARAVTPCSLIRIPGRDVDRLAREEPGFAYQVLRVLCRRLQETNAQTFMIDIWQVIGAEPNVSRLLQAAVKTAETALGARGLIILENDSWNRLEYKFATREEITLLDYLRNSLGTPVIGLVTGESVKLKVDRPQAERASDPRTVPPGQHFIQHPLSVEGRHLGTFRLISPNRLFKKEDEEFLHAFTEQVASAIELELLRGRIQRMETRLNGIFEAIAEGIIVLGNDGKPLMHNRAFREMFFPDGIGNGALSAIIPSLLNQHEEQGSQELVLLKPHAQIISGHFVKTITPDERHRETIISLRNVTSMRRNEQKFLQLIAMLIRRIQKLLERLPRSKKERFQRNLRKLRGMVNNLTALTEIKSGPLRVQRMPLEMAEFLDSFQNRMARVLARKRGICLLKPPAPIAIPGLVLADEDLLKQAFKTLFVFHATRMRRDSAIEIRQTIDGKHFSYSLDTKGDSWRTRPDVAILDWHQCMEWFISEENRAFLLDLAFARHIIESHKGTLDLKDDGATLTFTIKIPLEQ